MIPTTQEWQDYSVDNSNYIPYIVVENGNTIVWEFSDENIQEGSVTFTDDVSTIGGINIGATPSNRFECDIINFDQSFPSPDVFEGCVAKLYFFRGDQSLTDIPVGSSIWDLDYICRGHYYLDPITSVGSTVHISGSDAMSLEEYNSANMDGYSFDGKTCYEVIEEMGFNIQTTFPNYDYVLPDVTCSEEYALGGVSKRTVLGHIAAMCGCFARFNNEGVLELRAIGDDATVTTIAKIMEEPDVDYYAVVISGAYVTGQNGCDGIDGTDGFYFLVENNPLVTTDAEAESIAQHIASLYTNLEIYPFTLNVIADPAMEAGDIIEFESNGTTIQTLISSIDYHDGEISTYSAEVEREVHATPETAVGALGFVPRVINDLYNGDTLKRIINLSGDIVKIKGDTIDLTGAVFVDGTINCNDTFMVDPQGNVVASSFKAQGTAENPGSEEMRVIYTDSSDNEWVTALRGGGFVVYNGDNYANEVVISPGELYLAITGSAEPRIRLTVDSNNVGDIITDTLHARTNIEAPSFIGNASKASALNLSSAVGTNHRPVYFAATGKPAAISSLEIEDNIWSGLNNSTSMYYNGSRNSQNNVCMAAQASGNKVAGLYHLSTTGYSSARWLIYIDPSGTVTSSAGSDRRLKDEVSDLSDEEARAVLGVRTINYIYKADENKRVQSGVYAQDLRDILKEFGYRTYLSIESTTDDETDFYFDLEHDESEVIYGIDYSKLVPVLIKGWQMHEQKISELESKIERLEAMVETLMK